MSRVSLMGLSEVCILLLALAVEAFRGRGDNEKLLIALQPEGFDGSSNDRLQPKIGTRWWDESGSSAVYDATQNARSQGLRRYNHSGSASTS